MGVAGFRVYLNHLKHQRLVKSLPKTLGMVHEAVILHILGSLRLNELVALGRSGFSEVCSFAANACQSLRIWIVWGPGRQAFDEISGFHCVWFTGVIMMPVDTAINTAVGACSDSIMLRSRNDR